MQLSDELEYLVEGTLHENVMEKVLDESLHGWQLDHLAGYTLGRVALSFSVVQ